ncbi:MAG: DUF1670 domain-containing protein [Anaerolineales bacterium]
MINNSNIYRWDRLNSKGLDQQFVNEIVHGLNCSPFEASAVLETVYRVFGDYFDSSTNLKPGQIKLSVVSVEAQSAQRLLDAKQVTVTLTLTDDKEDLPIRKQSGIAGLRRHRIQRICQEALDQGGLLTVEDLAYRIFNCGQRTICRDLRYFRDNDILIPLRSTVKDIGRTLSHRVLIIKHWAKGKQYSEISRDTSHSLKAIQNYVDKFKRTVALYHAGYNVSKISFLLRLSAALIEEYIELYQQVDFIAHRRQELETFLKKSVHPDNQEVLP